MNRIDYGFEEYQANVLRTANTKLDWSETLENCFLGLIGELGEVLANLNPNSEILLKFVELAQVAEQLKKVKYHGKQFKSDSLTGEQYNLFHYSNHPVRFYPNIDATDTPKELGDVLYYLTWLIDTLGLEASEVAQANVEKLRKRYATGFSIEASLNRKD